MITDTVTLITCMKSYRNKMDCLLKNIHVLEGTLLKSVKAVLSLCPALLLPLAWPRFPQALSYTRRCFANLLTMVLQTVGTGFKALLFPLSTIHLIGILRSQTSVHVSLLFFFIQCQDFLQFSWQ